MPAYGTQVNFTDAIKLLVSFDLTVKSNLSVSLSFDLQIYEMDTFIA